MSAAVALRVASKAQRPSSSAITGKLIQILFRDLADKTTAAGLTWRTRPSAASTSSASRNGVREIDHSVHSAASSINAPACKAPSKMRERSRSAMSSCSELGTARMGWVGLHKADKCYVIFIITCNYKQW